MSPPSHHIPPSPLHPHTMLKSTGVSKGKEQISLFTQRLSHWAGSASRDHCHRQSASLCLSPSRVAGKDRHVYEEETHVRGITTPLSESDSDQAMSSILLIDNQFLTTSVFSHFNIFNWANSRRGYRPLTQQSPLTDCSAFLSLSTTHNWILLP